MFKNHHLFFSTINIFFYNYFLLYYLTTNTLGASHLAQFRHLEARVTRQPFPRLLPLVTFFLIKKSKNLKNERKS